MIGSLMMCVSVVVLFCGMVLGVAMGISEDFALRAAHAHLNLLAASCCFCSGSTTGSCRPPAPARWQKSKTGKRTGLAKEPGWLHIIGCILMPAGVAIVITHGTGFIAIPILGSLVMLAAMALFAVIVFRTARA
jgi:hypothetical protein